MSNDTSLYKVYSMGEMFVERKQSQSRTHIPLRMNYRKGNVESASDVVIRWLPTCLSSPVYSPGLDCMQLMDASRALYIVSLVQSKWQVMLIFR